MSSQALLKSWRKDWYQQSSVSPHGGHTCYSQSSQLRSAKNYLPWKLKSLQNLAAIQALFSDVFFTQIITKRHVH